MLYGILVGRNLDIQPAVNVADHGKPSTRISPITSAYFGQRPVDFIFLHLTNVSRAFVEQLMGHGPLALQYPACQLNIEIDIPTQLTELRQFVQWFQQLSTIRTAERNQYVIGYSTIIQSSESNRGRKSKSRSESWRLRFFAINVGQPHCVMRFFNEQECRPLLRNSWDFIKLFFHIPHGTLF
ncbi:hypothetical protein M3Y96_01209200 [Aphelenchoides besseyi]|nr:hypothetical protein M3Y96_01209200 [Aphelenchoides besseyi]